MADAMFTLDCREQFQILQTHRTIEPMLAPMLEGMCNTLAMGVEEYVRGFDARQGIDLLSSIGAENISSSGDAATMCLRALGLVLENVPQAIDIAAKNPAVTAMVRSKLAVMSALSYEAHSPGALCEDALRIVSFLCEQDNNGALIQSGILGEIAAAMNVVDTATMDRCLNALTAVLEKLYLPPTANVAANLRPSDGAAPAIDAAKEKDASSSDAPLPAGKKKQPARNRGNNTTNTKGGTALKPLSTSGAASVRRELESRIIPIVQRCLADSVHKQQQQQQQQQQQSSSSRDAWPTIEAALQCLDTIVYRVSTSWHHAVGKTAPLPVALTYQSPWVAPVEARDALLDAALTPDTVATVLACLTGPAHNEKRRLVVLSALTTIARVQRSCLMQPLLAREALDFFTELFAPAKRDLTSLLADAFPRRGMFGPGAGGSPGQQQQSNNNTSTSSLLTTAAAHFFFNVFPSLPASELFIRFRAVPVHVWQWADDMHTFTDYTDELSTILEAARVTLQQGVHLRVRGTGYTGDVTAMRQVNPSSGVARPIRRTFAPKTFAFVDWNAQVAVLAKDPRDGSGGVLPVPLLDEPLSSPPLALSGQPADDVLALLAAYGPVLSSFAQSATSEIHRALAVGSVARMVACVATPFPPAGFYACLEAIGEDLLSFIAAVVSHAEDLITTDAAFFLLHVLFAVAEQDAETQLSLARFSPNPDETNRNGHTVTAFARKCRRFGIAKKIASLGARLKTKADSSSGAAAPAANTDTGSPPMGRRSGPKGDGGQAAASTAQGCRALVSRAAVLESLCNARLDETGMSPQGTAASLGGAARDEDDGDDDAAAAPCSPLGQGAGLAAVVKQFASVPDLATKESLLVDICRTIAESPSLTVHEYGAVHLTSALARFLCAQDSATARASHDADSATTATVARQRMGAMARALQQYPAAAKTLVTMLVAELGTSARKLPESQSVGGRSADRCRPWTVALQRLNRLSPNVDLCCNKASNAAAQQAQQQEFKPPQCPGRHTLRPGTSQNWSCDLCGTHHDTPTSHGCRECDFDVCGACMAPPLPGVRANLVATVGDVESFYRLPAAERAVRQRASGGDGGGGLRGAGIRGLLGLIEQLGALSQAGGAGGGGPDPETRAEILRMALGANIMGGGGGAPSAARRQQRLADREAAGGDGDDSDSWMDDGDGEDHMVLELGPTGAISQAAAAAAGGGAGAAGDNDDAVPPLPSSSCRHPLYYTGLGRVGYQETLFSVFHRKAMGLGIGSAVAALEEAVMEAGVPRDSAIANGSLSAAAAPAVSPGRQPPVPSTPPRESSDATLGDVAAPSDPQTPIAPPPELNAAPAQRAKPLPFNPDSSPNNSLAGAGSRGNSPVDGSGSGLLPPTSTSQGIPMLRQRTYYLHVSDERTARAGGDLTCSCGEVNLTAGVALRADGSAYAVDEAERNLAADAPPNAAFRPPDLAATTRFTLLRILHSICVEAAVPARNGGGPIAEGIPKLETPLVPPELFVCHNLGIRAVKACAASAIRVALMPPQYALPAWLVECVFYAPYLIAKPVLQQLLAFITVGARRQLCEAVQAQGLFATPPTQGCVVVPGEWGELSNAHAFVNRPPPKEVLRRDEDAFEAEALETLMRSAERRAPLMFEFKGDKGTGQGPTMQFYTLVADHLARAGRGLWRSDEGDGGDAVDATKRYVTVPAEGLSFKLGAKTAAQTQALYLCGATCARALLDGRIFPLPLSPALFYALRRRLGLHKRHPSALDAEVRAADATLAQSLAMLAALDARYLRGEDVTDDVDALALAFVLPGDESYELRPGGADEAVTAENLHTFIDLVKRAVVEDSMADALDAFVTGFRDVAPPDACFLLDAEALCDTVTGVGGGGTDLWTTTDLDKAITGDHGYSRESRELAWLREILAALSPDDQRAFLRFATGCPRLPVGGLSSLGQITVVRKDAVSDTCLGLPSVNTCFRYLKLPPYPTLEEMRVNLMRAVHDAGDAFDLS